MRAAETYRGARRNAARGALGAMAKIGRVGARPYRWPANPHAVSRSELSYLGYRPHQGEREKARRVRRAAKTRGPQ